jgi:uncharacterized protein
VTRRSIAGRKGLVVREGIRGRGVFATRAFAEGETVEVCPTIEFPVGGADGLGDYVFESTTEGMLLIALGYGMLYNHSDDPNVDYYEDAPGALEFIALRAIEPGEELTISYGEEWWSARGLEPL